MKIRMADIAEKLGISIVTVSKALNGKDGVGDELRANILKVANEMGYQGKTSEIKPAESYTIGIVTSHKYLERGSSFYWSLYERLLMHLSKNSDLGILEVVGADEENELIFPRLIQEKRVDGIIIMGNFSFEYIQFLSKADIPLVMLDSYNADLSLDTVISDGYYGMYAMTNYLIKNGHRKIMYVGTIGETSSITDRYFGYCRAMIEAGITVTSDMVIPDRDDEGKIDVNLPKFTEESRPTALACNCDFTAYDVLNKLLEANISVPDEISIVGFDDYILSEMARVKITTYGVNQDGMASKSARQIRKRIRNRSLPRNVSIISGEIVIRESVKNIL